MSLHAWWRCADRRFVIVQIQRFEDVAPIFETWDVDRFRHEFAISVPD